MAKNSKASIIWLVESSKDGQVEYLTPKLGRAQFTTDPHEALQFVRMADAVTIADQIESRNCTAEEHQFG